MSPDADHVARLGSFVTPVPGGGFKAEVYLVRAPVPFASWECETREDAEAVIREFAEWMQACQAQRREESERRAAESRERFIEQVRAHRAEAKRLLRARPWAPSVTIANGDEYHRHEFPSLSRDAAWRRQLVRVSVRRIAAHTQAPRIREHRSSVVRRARAPAAEPSGSGDADPPRLARGVPA